jgi:hypothetical protein
MSVGVRVSAILHFYACHSLCGPGDLLEPPQMLPTQRAGGLRLRSMARAVISIYRGL